MIKLIFGPSFPPVLDLDDVVELNANLREVTHQLLKLGAAETIVYVVSCGEGRARWIRGTVAILVAKLFVLERHVMR